ncbi:MAG: tRNA uridine-5-carboxymethylaminomethyl(34) synthesis GTPase MnmE, partial [Deltaproteobacteria bacterium]|nr:tRNA uridine-5-carboxymethylaminomethyl(34) synthesis GTPase MnmE [Deltaproteobacteria bacterium]
MTTTIAALATAAAPAGVAIVRVSGPDTSNLLKLHFHSSGDPTKTPRKLLLGEVWDHSTGQALDQA